MVQKFIHVKLALLILIKMHPTLRKRHRIIWIIIAVVLPLLFITAIMVIPKKVKQEKLYQTPAKTTGYYFIKEKTNCKI